MFVTISLLLEGTKVIKEHVHSHDATSTPVACRDYLASRQGTMTRYAYTPVKIAVMKKNTPLVHIVEFTGYHYCLKRSVNADAYYWWANANSVSLQSSPAALIDARYTLPALDPLTAELALRLADDYFNDRFHLVDEKKD